MATEFSTSDPNFVDRAAVSASDAVKATQRATSAALDSVSDKIGDIRDRASPVVDRIAAPFDEVSRYARQDPLKSLLMAAAAGAALMALIALMRRSD